MPVVLSVARKLEIPTLFFVSLPFTLEGHSKRKIAEDTVKEELLGLADAVICLPNDLLFSVLESTTPLSNAFKLADQELSRTVLALTMVLLHGKSAGGRFRQFHHAPAPEKELLQHRCRRGVERDRRRKPRRGRDGTAAALSAARRGG